MSDGVYTVYHLHTYYSNADGFADSCSGFMEYIKLAKKQGMKAIAFSEHGNFYDWIKKKQACDKAGIKYIHGIETYVCTDLAEDDRGSHIGLYARNWDGVLELNALMSTATSKGIAEDKSDRHLYYRPRISLQELMNTSDNVIVTSACLASPLNKWDTPEKRQFFQTLVRWMMKNKHRCFLEVQYHDDAGQAMFNRKLYQYSKRTGIPLIAGTDTHSSSSYKAECRKILQKYKESFYGDEDAFDLTWKTYDELVAAFAKQNALPESVYLEAIENTNRFADMIEDFTLDKAFKYPTLYGDNARSQWRDLIDACFEKRLAGNELKLPSKIRRECKMYFAANPQIPQDETEAHIYKTYKDMLAWADEHSDQDIIAQYKAIIDEEFDAMCKLGMESFMMFMSELASWAQDNGIPRGTGRGSVCGSMIAYITHVTDVDPMVWDTVFSRFCNADRISLADVDVDYAGEDRERVYQYIINRFTPEKTAYIAAFSTLQDRGCIDVLAGGLGYDDLDKVMDIKDHFDDYYSRYSKIIQEEVNSEELVENGEIDSASVSFDHHKVYLSHVNNEKAYADLELIKKQYDSLIAANQDLFYYLDGLKGTIVAKGTHPSGIIGSPITLSDNLGLFYKDGDPNMPVSTCAMKAVDSLNYVKFDILGLKTVGIIKDACKYAGIPYPESFALNWNDAAVWKDMVKAQQGVPQFEGDYAFSLLKNFKPTTINHMSMVNAALRPSGKSYRDRLIAGEKNKNPSQEIDNLLASNNGYLIFQEDTIRFLTDICGFTGSAADTTRRCLDENTLVLMGDGNYKCIKDIAVGDIVQSFSNHDTSEAKPVVNVFDNGLQNVFSITTEHQYEIQATANHPVLTQRGYVNVRDLTENDWLMTPKYLQCTADNKRPNQRLSCSTMYLIGLLIGDGCIGKQNDIHFTNHEQILIDQFKDCVNKLSRHNTECEFSITKQNGVDVDSIQSIYIRSKSHKEILSNLLNKFDLRHDAADKYIPDELMKYPADRKLAHLLAGLFNTDGGYHKQSSSIEYYSISKRLVWQIKSLLLKYGIYSYIVSKTVKEYGYSAYSLRICQPTSLSGFEQYILPYILGEKHNQFQDIINNAVLNQDKYNYLLPSECKTEIKEMSVKKHHSLYSIDRISLHKSEPCITDVKAQKIIQSIFAPMTYKLLLADYIPVRITGIKPCGITHVYDIEVADNHNFVANNLIVHNCIGKKDAETLKLQLPKILEGYCNNSPKERSVAEQEAKQFVQIIQDSSEYQFGKNHATAYSMNGYECVWLRTYYPVEFVAAYANRAENKDDINFTMELAKQYNITINPIRFGKSLGDYAIDKKNRAIYKGIASIKYCNHTIADELMALAKSRAYISFIDLLDDISEKTSVDNRQLKILTGLNFFSDFGKNQRLLDIIALYNGIKEKDPVTKKVKQVLPSLRSCKTISKEKLIEYERFGISECVVKANSSKETPKQYSQIDNLGLLRDLADNIKNETMHLQDYLRFEREYLQYITYCDPSIQSDNLYIVVDFKTYKNPSKPYLILRNLKTGDEVKTKITSGKLYMQQPFGEFDCLEIERFTPRNKRKFVGGQWIVSQETEPVLESYIVNDQMRCAYA